MKKTRTNSLTSNFFRAVVYEESTTFYPIKDILFNLQSLDMMVWAVKHDHDFKVNDITDPEFDPDEVEINVDGNQVLKKSHWHFVIVPSGNRKIQESRIKNALGGEIFLYLGYAYGKNLTDYCRYLYHIDEDETKYHYHVDLENLNYFYSTDKKSYCNFKSYGIDPAAVLSAFNLNSVPLTDEELRASDIKSYFNFDMSLKTYFEKHPDHWRDIPILSKTRKLLYGDEINVELNSIPSLLDTREILMEQIKGLQFADETLTLQREKDLQQLNDIQARLKEWNEFQFSKSKQINFNESDDTNEF